MVRRLLLIATLALAACPCAAAAAGGEGLGTIAAPAGVTVSGSPYRYVAAITGGGDRPTLVERIIRDGGVVDRRWSLRGRYFVPAVAYDGSGGGLSADGSTLVLARLARSYSPRRSRFAILDTALRARPSRRSGDQPSDHAVSLLSLRGFYSFDAISPDGETVYLIHYLTARGPAAYEVRAFDLPSGRLLRDPVIDPEEAGERMEGLPITRAMSPDGRWAYTLYDGNGKEPFLHALDTVRGSAVCVDLPQLAGRRDLFGSGLRVGGSGRELAVLSASTPARQPLHLRHARPLLTIDTRTFAVHGPALAVAETGGGTLPWAPIAVGVAALAAVLIGVLARRERIAGGEPLEQG
jgi:hypothetical protein